MLFEVAILEHPTKKEAEEGAMDKLIFGPKAVVARDPQGAVVAALLGPGKPESVDLNRAEVLVRPFVQQSSGKFFGAEPQALKSTGLSKTTTSSGKLGEPYKYMHVAPSDAEVREVMRAVLNIQPPEFASMTYVSRAPNAVAFSGNALTSTLSAARLGS